MSALGLIRLEGRRKTPLIRQTEASECGLACLAMVAGHHRMETDLTTLRRRFSLSLKGVTLKTLIGMAEQMGLNCRPLRTDVSDLSQVQCPAIIG